MPQSTLSYMSLLVPSQNPNPSQALRKSPYDTYEWVLVKESSVGGFVLPLPSIPLPPLPLCPCAPSVLGPTPQVPPTHVTASDGCLSTSPGCCEHRLSQAPPT